MNIEWMRNDNELSKRTGKKKVEIDETAMELRKKM